MKLWVAREIVGWLGLYKTKPIYKIDQYGGNWAGCFMGFVDNDLDINKTVLPEVTHANSPQEIEFKLSNHTSKPLTRDYFANHNWEIIIPEPDENGFILWEARWIRRMEKGSPYYSDLTVTNMMYEDRFCISGKTSEGSVQYLMAYTEEDLENILKVLDIYDYYKKES